MKSEIYVTGFNYLKIIYNIKNTASVPSQEVAESKDASLGETLMFMHHLHLEDKLQELWEKCYQMEDLMKGLKEMRREQKNNLQLHNELDSGRRTSSQAHMMDGIIAWTTTGHTAKDVSDSFTAAWDQEETKETSGCLGMPQPAERGSEVLLEWQRVYS